MYLRPKSFRTIFEKRTPVYSFAAPLLGLAKSTLYILLDDVLSDFLHSSLLERVTTCLGLSSLASDSLSLKTFTKDFPFLYMFVLLLNGAFCCLGFEDLFLRTVFDLTM